jgi:hypothetical protein
MSLTPSCVWRTTDEVIRALDRQLGDPLDAYVNGSQTWLRDDGPGGITLEWRLHPVAGYERPPDVASHYDVFPSIAFALTNDDEPATAAATLWDGLEAFPAYEDEVEPAQLAAAVTQALGIAPDRCGLVDHDAVAAEWERAGGSTSVVDALLTQLDAYPSSSADPSP